MKREKRLGWVSSQTEVIARTAELARVWGTTDQVGIAEEIDLGEVGLLALLVEKDFGVWSEETKITETSLTIRMPVRIAGLL